jgi:hypothetical protein
MSTITTYLEMHSPDQLRARRCADERFQVREKKERDWRFNRDLYAAVGASWSWADRRIWTDEQWREYGLAPELRTFGAYHGDSLAGYYELRRDDGGVEIAYFGLLLRLHRPRIRRRFAHQRHRASVADVAFCHACLGAHLHARSSARARELSGQRIHDLSGGREIAPHAEGRGAAAP